MNDATYTPEQQQLRVEMEAVAKNIGKHGSDAGYEIEQGRKLIEKALALGLPEQAYADLQRHIASHDGR